MVTVIVNPDTSFDELRPIRVRGLIMGSETVALSKAEALELVKGLLGVVRLMNARSKYQRKPVQRSLFQTPLEEAKERTEKARAEMQRVVSISAISGLGTEYVELWDLINIKAITITQLIEQLLKKME